MEFEKILHIVVTCFIHVLECIGILIIMVGGLRTFISYVRSGFNADRHDIKLGFARSLAFSLEFKLAGEILRTVITKTISEMYVLGAIILLRAILTVVIHYEIKFETENERLEQEQEQLEQKQSK